MIGLFQKFLALIESLFTLVMPIASPTPVLPSESPIVIVASVSPTPTESSTTEPTVSPTSVPTPTPSTPTVQEVAGQIAELKSILASYTPEPTPTPIVVFVTVTPSPTPTPSATASPTPTPSPTTTPPYFFGSVYERYRTKYTDGSTGFAFGTLYYQASSEFDDPRSQKYRLFCDVSGTAGYYIGTGKIGEKTLDGIKYYEMDGGESVASGSYQRHYTCQFRFFLSEGTLSSDWFEFDFP